MTESLTHAIYSYQGYFKKKLSPEKVNEKYNSYLDNLQYLVNLDILCVCVTYLIPRKQYAYKKKKKKKKIEG